MRRLAALLTVVAVGFGGLSLAPAQATYQHDDYVSADPVDWTPNVTSGKVRALATVDGVTVAVGDFDGVREVGSSSTIARQDIFAFDSSGEVSDNFAPLFTGSELYDVIDAGDGTSVFVAGSFSRVDGLGGTGRIVKLNVHTGAVVRAFRSPGFNTRTTSLHLTNGRLYVAGDFATVGGVPRTSLVALDPTTGDDTGAVALTFSGTWNGGIVGIEKITMTPDGSRLVAIGNFRFVNGQSRPQIVMINTEGATATLDSWATTRFSTTCSRSFETYMYDVDASPDGSYFVVVTTGAYSGGVGSGTLCDAASRWEFGRTGSGQQPTWVEYSGGDTFTAVEVTGPAVYVGGHFRWMNNPFAGDRASQGAVPRKGLAALDPRNGLPLSWNPGRERGWGVWGFRADEMGLWLGHDTDTVGGETHSRVALMPLAGGSTPLVENTGSLPGDVHLLGVVGTGSDDLVQANSLSAGGSVTGTAAVDPGTVDWSTARGAFMVDNFVYTGWSDGRFNYRTFNGTRFGNLRSINLYQLTDFISELPLIRAMWYDQVTGRLYFTRTNSSSLFYRYFTTESRVVGAQRFTVPASGVDWSRVTGGFLAGGELYYRTDAGNLNSMDWSTGPVAGSVAPVSGPAIDGVNWNSRALFLEVQ